MKKRILLAAMALMIVSGCSNGEETSVSEPESTAESSIVSVVESMESSVKESSVESKPESSVESKEENSKKESSVESKEENSKKESSVESKEENSKKESSVENKEESSKKESSVESKEESSKKESSVESKEESRKKESSVEIKEESNKKESSVENKEESSKEETSVIPATNRELVGFYNLTEMNNDGENVVSMKLYNSAGMYVTLEINAGGTGIFTEYKDKKNITWNDKYINLTHYDDMEYNVSGDRLALYGDEMTLVFERTDKEALKKKMEEISKPEELSGEIDPDAVGDYILKETDMEDAFEFDGDVYLTLHNDGTGYLESEGEQLEIAWVDGEIKAMDDIFYYEKEGNDIVVDFYGIYVTFGKV